VVVFDSQFIGSVAIYGVSPEVTDLSIALEPWSKVYLPAVVK
jgi:hypothetical protein